jgi:transposase
LHSEPKSRLDRFAVIDGVASRLEESPPLLRRRWSSDAKARILEEALAPGANVSAVARSHGISPQQLFAWRRNALRSGAISLFPVPEGQSFAPVVVARDNNHHTGGLDIVIGDVTICVGSDVAPALLVEAIRAVRSA